MVKINFLKIIKKKKKKLRLPALCQERRRARQQPRPPPADVPADRRGRVRAPRPHLARGGAPPGQAPDCGPGRARDPGGGRGAPLVPRGAAAGAGHAQRDAAERAGAHCEGPAVGGGDRGDRARRDAARGAPSERGGSGGSGGSGGGSSRCAAAVPAPAGTASASADAASSSCCCCPGRAKLGAAAPLRGKLEVFSFSFFPF